MIARFLASGAAVLCVLALGVGSTIFVANGRDVSETTRTRSALADLSREMAEALDEGMHEHWQAIRSLAASDVAGVDAGANRARRAAYNALKGREPRWAWIGFASDTGTVVASTDGILEGVSVAARPWFGRGRMAPSALDVHEARLLAPLLGGDPASPPRFVDVTAPLLWADGSLRGVLGGHLSWTWAKAVEQSVRAAASPPDGTEILVVSETGDVLLGPNGAERSLVVRGDTWNDARTGLSASARTLGRGTYPGLGWTVVARRSVSAIQAPVDALRFWGFAASLVVASGAGIGTFAVMTAASSSEPRLAKSR